jgi:hypothetical protein
MTDDDRCDCEFTPVKVVSRISGSGWHAVIYAGEEGGDGIDVIVGGRSEKWWPFDSIDHATETARRFALDPRPPPQSMIRVHGCASVCMGVHVRARSRTSRARLCRRGSSSSTSRGRGVGVATAIDPQLAPHLSHEISARSETASPSPRPSHLEEGL